MALAQAQNQIETRSGAGTCYGLPSVKDLRVLVVRFHAHLKFSWNNRQDLIQRHRGADVRGINPQTGRGYDVAAQITATGMGQYVPLGSVTYNITIRSTNGTTLDAIQLPDIWFANFGDTLWDKAALGQPGFMGNFAPWLVPPWQMVGGQHVEGSLGLVERKFITSSVFRDIVANLKPTYDSVSLVTITTKDTTPLTDDLTASALLTPSLVSSLSYLNDLSDFQRSKNLFTSMQPVCAFIEDYRSSTIFDALGSVGGLLAILQGVHILLFGRPMFWGLTGAKLINPFGIFGRCHSRGFRRRLREQYHRQPARGQTCDAAEAIRINAFLRDFVIDFGPADVDDEEDIETRRHRNREVHLQTERDGSRRDDEYDPNDTVSVQLAFAASQGPTKFSRQRHYNGDYELNLGTLVSNIRISTIY
ncbi:hypothetical protein FRC10_004864 [Ceratobasidium sp. 414]|nr:hypothetical protein FRC10_004864 [Ceratobasidium sp. 414]